MAVPETTGQVVGRLADMEETLNRVRKELTALASSDIDLNWTLGVVAADQVRLYVRHLSGSLTTDAENVMLMAALFRTVPAGTPVEVR